MTKRNEAKRCKAKRNETKRSETKQNETKRNETYVPVLAAFNSVMHFFLVAAVAVYEMFKAETWSIRFFKMVFRRKRDCGGRTFLREKGAEKNKDNNLIM